MKKFIIMTILISSFAACKKENQIKSDNVLITITNVCRATIKFYNVSDGRQYLSSIFDCDYVSILPIKVLPGQYIIKAETYQGKSVTKRFTKGLYAQEIDMEF